MNQTPTLTNVDAFNRGLCLTSSPFDLRFSRVSAGFAHDQGGTFMFLQNLNFNMTVFVYDI